MAPKDGEAFRVMSATRGTEVHAESTQPNRAQTVDSEHLWYEHGGHGLADRSKDQQTRRLASRRHVFPWRGLGTQLNLECVRLS